MADSPRHRSRRLCTRLAALCVAAALSLACVPAAALAEGLGSGGALSELTEGSQEAETTKTATTAASTEETSSKKSSSVVAVVIGAGVVLLMGVAFVIVRDARRVAPATDVDVIQGSSVARHSEAALRKRRAKAKAARRQRKRNR